MQERLKKQDLIQPGNMTEIRQHVHIYMLLFAAILLGVAGVMSLFRMNAMSRQYSKIVAGAERIEANQAKIIKHIEREEAIWKASKP